MLKGVAPAVRKEFDKAIKARLPQFVRAKPSEVLWYKGPSFKKGEELVTPLSSDMIVYALKYSDDLWYFTHLQTSSKSWENWFCVELAWNDRPVYWSTTVNDRIMPPVYEAANPGKKPLGGKAKFRLRTVICGEKIDGWWLTPDRDPRPIKEVPIEEAMANVQPMVRDAIEKICTRGLEWFRIVAEKRGFDPNDKRLRAEQA